MSWKRVTARTDGRAPAGLFAAGAATGLVILWLAYAFLLTFTATIDGRPQRLSADTIVSDLYEKKLVHGEAGDLVAAKDHKVLEPGKGEAPYVLVNGERAKNDMRLHGSDVVESRDGTDVVEPLVKHTEPIPVTVKYRGSGSVETVVTSGTAGLRELTVGRLSKQVVSTRVVRAAVARVVQRRSPNSRMAVALTFDDGPWPGQTEAILKVLQKYKIKATFFEIGSQAKGRPHLSKMLADAGMQLGNHTQTHASLKKLSADAISRQIRQGEESIEKASGQRPRFFRPPGGAMSAAVTPVLNDLGLKLVQWDIDPHDWKKPGVSSIVGTVVNNVRPGAVVLMHDGGGDRSQTIQALPQIIEKLQAMGYEFVTLDQLSSLPVHLG